jgi:hypothetical protein
MTYISLKFCFGIIAFLLMLSVSSSAQIPGQRGVLRGLYPPSVEVEPLASDAEQNGLSTGQIQTDVELRLRKAGIRLTTPKSSDEPAYPQVNVSVRILKSSSGIYAFSVRIQLLTLVNVNIDQGKSRLMFASVWETGTIGTVGQAKLRDLRGIVGDLVDEFINDYLAENPK